MRYINNYNYNTLIIIDSKNNETVGKVLLDIEDIPTEEEAKQARSLYCENQ